MKKSVLNSYMAYACYGAKAVEIMEKCEHCGRYFIIGENGSREYTSTLGDEYENICDECKEVVDQGQEPEYIDEFTIEDHMEKN